MAKTILIVDDEATLRWVLKAALESEKYKIVEAASGKEGIEMAKSTNPDLIIMDYKMPDINGWQATKAILKESPNLPIIGHTGYANDKNIEDGFEAGCVEILHKPVDLDEWETTISKYI